jgi:serine phosphatase RsbU (regulator of sigma subunit)
MSVEENKILSRRFWEASWLNQDVLDELLASDFVDHTLLPGQESDHEGRKISGAELAAPFSDISLTADDQIAEGDRVVTRWTIKGTHDRSEFFGAPPTGERITMNVIVIHRISEGKVAEEWSQADDILIVLPALEQQIRERARVEQELQVARRIQQASLPKAVPTLEGWQISSYYRPAREVGGDFYDFLELPNGRLGLVVGDATGKGVPAALVMSTTCGMLEAVAPSLDSPGEALERVNEALFARIPQNMFVTCFYAILDSKSGHLIYANAGHDLPYARRGGECEELRARGMPLGLMPGMSYEEKELVLDAGEAVLFYSDGLVEAHDPEREMFGFPRLQTLVAEYGKAGSLEEALLAELYSFVGKDWEQEDDITLLTLERHAARGRTS